MKRLAKRAARMLGYDIRGTSQTPRHLLDPACVRTLEFDDVVSRQILASAGRFTFAQIGAFDGLTRDPLRKYIQTWGWSGVLVEPQAHAAKRLTELYRANDGITVLQAAVDATRGSRVLFSVDTNEAPEWVGGLASFERANIVKHARIVPGLERMIRQETVNCITFDDVLQALGTHQLDLLQIDTEGADGYLLGLFPFERLRPAIVHWEVKHLTKPERESCLDRLARFGYRFAPSGDEDMTAVTF